MTAFTVFEAGYRWTPLKPDRKALEVLAAGATGSQVPAVDCCPASTEGASTAFAHVAAAKGSARAAVALRGRT